MGHNFDNRAATPFAFSFFQQFFNFVVPLNFRWIALHGSPFLLAIMISLYPSEGAIQSQASSLPVKTHIGGYPGAPLEEASTDFGSGFSFYTAIWPLLKNYPGRDFQSGLFGTWMGPQYDTPESIKEIPGEPKHYSDIEGGVGWSRGQRFLTETPKFNMGGVSMHFFEVCNGPGAGGMPGDWSISKGKYGAAQLSPWVLWPPDGLNLKEGTCGELLGYGYLKLPLTLPKGKTAGANVPTGNNCWTLFLNSGNFKGPVAFFLPYFWSKPTVTHPEYSGTFLDSLPARSYKIGLSIESQNIAAYLSKDKTSQLYVRVDPPLFPGNLESTSPLLNRMAAYNDSALWDDMNTWLNGGKPCSGEINLKGCCFRKFTGRGTLGWWIFPGTRDKVPIDQNFVSPKVVDDFTFCFQWHNALNLLKGVDQVKGALISIPEYYRLEKQENGHNKWVAINPSEVPKETGLASVKFPQGIRPPDVEPYLTPDDPKSCWKNPGPVAGPFKVKLGDGSQLTYYWYRFADQPSLLNADMTNTEREMLQKRVELLHRNWTKDRDYLPPPTAGKLADLDPGLIVSPPKGFEFGYVPIVTKQEQAKN